MTEFLGMNFPTPDITGLLSQSWIYIAIIVILTIIVGVTLCLVLFFMTYNIKVELYENIGGGKKMVRTLRTRARRIKVGSGGEELLKLLRPRVYRTAYGQKIAPRTYAFAVGSDGYWYNITMGDLDTQLGILDVEPIDRDMRMSYLANEIIIKTNYDPNKNMQIIMGIAMFVVIVIFLIGCYMIVSKGATLVTGFQGAVDGFQRVAETQAKTTQLLVNSGLSPGTATGIVSAG
jgi:hypothetical protein